MTASTPSPSWTAERLLIWALLAGLVLSAVGCAVGWAGSSGWARALAVALLLVAALGWWWLIGRPRSRAGLLTVVLATLLTLASPLTAGFSVLQTFLVVTLVGLWVGAAAASATAVVGGAIIAATALSFYDITLADGLAQGLTVTIFLLVAALLGGVSRRAERSRRRAEVLNTELRAANVKLQDALATERELVLAQERARSARELHDGLGHRLTAAKMSLEFAQRVREEDPGRAWEEVDRAMGTTKESLRDIRLWARALNPPPPRQGARGAAAFDAIADAFRGTGLDVTLTHRGSTGPLPHDVQLFVTRVIQEGLTNVLKHAVAEHVEIEIVQSPSQLRLTMTDDGAGRWAGGPGGDGEDHSAGFGLRSLQERARSLGGRVEAGRGPTGGYRLVATVPLGQEG